MLTCIVKKIMNTIMATKPPTESEYEGVDADLIAIQDEYLDNAPGVNQIEMGVINHMDTQHIDPMRIILQHLKLEVASKGK